MTLSGNSVTDIVRETLSLISVCGPEDDVLPMMLLEQQLTPLISSLHYQLKSLLAIYNIVHYTLVPEMVGDVYYFYITVQDK